MWWFVGFYIMMLIFFYIGFFGYGLGIISNFVDFILVVIGLFVIYYWVKYIGFLKVVIDYDK